MPTATPKYKGQGSDTDPPQFSGELRDRLRKYYPNPSEPAEPGWTNPADLFVEGLLAEASWAASELHWHGLDSTKQEVRAEIVDLTKAARRLQEKLRRISRDVDIHLPSEADPLGLADALQTLVRHLQVAAEAAGKMPARKKNYGKQRDVMVEMAIRVLRYLNGHGIPPSATADADLDTASDAVSILKEIGDDMRLRRSATTWRDIIIEVHTDL